MHRYRVSSFSSTARTPCIRLGVTQVCRTSSLTRSAELLPETDIEGRDAGVPSGATDSEGVEAFSGDKVEGVVGTGVAGVLAQTSSLKLSNASMSIVCSSGAAGMLHREEGKLLNDGKQSL